ncbi:MAG: HU family DNA-binding protein [Bacteroidales bacterium]
MAILYKPQEFSFKTGSNEDKKNGIYPKVISRRVLNTDDLAEMIASCENYSEAGAKAAIEVVFRSIEKALSDECFVSIDDFGRFEVTAKYKEEVEPTTQTRRESIEVKNVIFINSKEVKRNVGMKGFKRADRDLIERKEAISKSKKR